MYRSASGIDAFSGFSRYHPSSTTTYCQPNSFSCAAITTILARNCASFTVSPYESQLFHPIGGVGASTLSCAPIRETMSNKTAAAQKRFIPMRTNIPKITPA